MTEPAAPIDLAALREGTLAVIIPQLPDLTDEQVDALLAAELAADPPRKGLVEACELEKLHRASARDDADAANAAQAGDSEAARIAAKDAAAAEEAAKASAPPAWKDPDYAGPLTGTQAAWRHANLKPAWAPVTK